VSSQDPATLQRFFSDLAGGGLLVEQGAEAFVATLSNETPEFVSVRPAVYCFTRFPRAYIGILVVAAEAKDKGTRSP